MLAEKPLGGFEQRVTWSHIQFKEIILAERDEGQNGETSPEVIGIILVSDNSDLDQSKAVGW